MASVRRVTRPEDQQSPSRAFEQSRPASEIGALVVVAFQNQHDSELSGTRGDQPAGGIDCLVSLVGAISCIHFASLWFRSLA